MDLKDIESRVQGHISGAEVQAETDGYYVTVNVVSDEFEGMRAVKRQQLVYGALTDLISSGALHAVNINAKTPSEAE